MGVSEWAGEHSTADSATAATRTGFGVGSWTYWGRTFGVAKTLHQLREPFYWPNCRVDMELYAPLNF